MYGTISNGCILTKFGKIEAIVSILFDTSVVDSSIGCDTLTIYKQDVMVVADHITFWQSCCFGIINVLFIVVFLFVGSLSWKKVMFG